MAKAILYRNDEADLSRKSAWVCRNVERALARLARETGRDCRREPALDVAGRAGRATTYVSCHSVVSIGLTAHERLAAILRRSLVYLDPAGPDAEAPPSFGSPEPFRNAATTILVGDRARRAARTLPFAATRHYDLPPLDLSDLPPCPADAPRLTIVNHLREASLARSLVDRFLQAGDFFLECIGLAGEAHNRVRYLGDADVAEAAANVHVHVGLHGERGDRLRVCDSWHSGVPVLFFDIDGSAPPGSTGRLAPRHEHDVLVCRTCEEAASYLEIILETPSLRRLMTANGRGSAAPMARDWSQIAQDLAA